MPGGKGCPMKKSKNKYSPWPAVALCLVFLALRIVDLALFTDPETSFPTVGPSAARWGTALVGAAALLVMGRRADEKIAPGRKSLMGVMMAVTGSVLVLAGLSQLLSATVVWPSMVLLTAAGVWFFAMGWRVLSTPEGRGTAMPPNAVPVPDPTAALLWVLIQRFSIIRRHRRGLAVPSGCWGRWARCFVWGCCASCCMFPAVPMAARCSSTAAWRFTLQPATNCRRPSLSWCAAASLNKPC